MTVVVKRSIIDPQVRTIIVTGGTYRQVALEHLSRLARTALTTYRLNHDAQQETAYEQKSGHRLELGTDFVALEERARVHLLDYENEVGATPFIVAAKETLRHAMDPVAPLQLLLDAHIRAIHEATLPGMHGPSLVSVSADHGSLAIHIVASPGEGLRPAVMELIAEHRRAGTILRPQK